MRPATRFLSWMFSIVILIAATASFAQTPADEPGLDQNVEMAAIADDEGFRDTSGYRFPALSRTVRDLQHLAFAMQLRDYCADDRVSDDFVRARLARFSLLTGREENCRSLKNY